MGRVARYKKVKSIDPFAKNGSWKSDVGDCNTFRRVKRKSATALRLKEQKASQAQRRLRGKDRAGDAGTRSGGCNGWGDDDGYDLPPVGGDEFDMDDLMGSVKQQTLKPPPFSETKTMASVAAPGDKTWTSKAERVDMRGVGVATSGAQSSRNGKKEKTKDNGALIITAKTSTKAIIAACSNPKPKKDTDNDASSSKKEKRKAFLERKKLKKRNRKSSAWNDDDYARQSSSTKDHVQGKPAKQQNHTHTLVARSALGDQVERPPTFTSLPRGANKLEKNKKAAQSRNTKDDGASVLQEEGEGEKAQRIRKEQQALEAMRERVMKQYAILRESRRSVGR